MVYSAKSIRIHVFDSAGRPVSAHALRGTVTLTLKGAPKTYRYDLYPEGTRSSLPNVMYVPVNLSVANDKKVTARFAIHGFSSSKRLVAFSQPVQLPPTRSVTPMFVSQQICPVSRKRLGSMGKPIKTVIEGREIYVCCSGCIGPLKKNPKKYLARLTGSREAAKAPKAPRR